jgi:cytochrome c oxidase assembly protein subunit 15
VAFGLLIAQIALGGWTSSNYAGAACADFPTCQGRLLPEADFAAAFVPWHGAVNYEGGVLDAPARTAIHLTHRAGAITAGMALVILAALSLSRATSRRVRRAAIALLLAVMAQWLIGVNLIWRGLPLSLGTLHNAGAALLVLTMVALTRALWPGHAGRLH